MNVRVSLSVLVFDYDTNYTNKFELNGKKKKKNQRN